MPARVCAPIRVSPNARRDPAVVSLDGISAGTLAMMVLSVISSTAGFTARHPRQPNRGAV